MERLLPPGSIIKLGLDEKDEKIMIVSRLAKANDEDKLSDYCGCTLPIGFRDASELYFFNHSDVKLLIFMGFQDPEELNYAFSIAEYKEAHLNDF